MTDTPPAFAEDARAQKLAKEGKVGKAGQVSRLATLNEAQKWEASRRAGMQRGSREFED